VKTGFLLFAHGARDPVWAAPFEAVGAQLRAMRPDAEVRLGFLEFMSPTLAQAGAQLVAAGCARIQVVPLFLGAGGHVRKDVPALLATLQAAHPAVAIALHPAIGEHAEVIASMARAAASLDTSAP
jgi:sirohydrochlorin cobaltochelatase